MKRPAAGTSQGGPGRRSSVALAGLALAAGLAAADTRACGFHDAGSVRVGMLNLAYPDALHVRTAVWLAQRDAIVPREPPLAFDASSAEYRLDAMRRYRETVAALDALRERLVPSDATPRFAVVLIGSMLWTRFEPVAGRLRMTPHASGPLPDDVVVVTDGPVLRGLLDGTLTPADAHARGLIRLYGATRPKAGVTSLLDRLRSAPGAAGGATAGARSPLPRPAAEHPTQDRPAPPA